MSFLNFLNRYFQNFKRNRYKNRVKRIINSYGSDLKVNGSTYLTKNTFLGSNVNFNGMRIHGKGRVTIGDNFHSGTDCMLITDIHNYDKGTAIPYDDTVISKDITIKDNVWLGNKVMILQGVTIEEGAIIQAGSVVVNNIPKYAIAGGHPAKVFKYRDINHYERLKNEKKFH
jgi:acetyltransferase-like isoleucine patch superfamily enzyme